MKEEWCWEELEDIWCIGCQKYHKFDMTLKQVACPHEHPLDYPNTNK